MPEAPERLVFVYGTLRRGGRNDINRLVPTPVYVERARVRGRLYPLGWYPGLLLGGDGAIEIVGEVYRITPELEARLDEIEEIHDGPDSEYRKREVAVQVAGRACTCLVYEINPERVRGCPPLAHGDWIAFYA